MCEFKNFTQIEYDQSQQLGLKFPKAGMIPLWRSELIIPTKNIGSISINDGMFDKIIDSKYWDRFLKMISEAKKSSWSINITDSPEYIWNLTKYLPSKWNFSIINSFTSDSIDLNLDKADEIVDYFKGMKITSFEIIDYLNENNWAILLKILSLPNVKQYWTVLRLLIENLNQAIDVANIILDYQRLEKIWVVYHYVLDKNIFMQCLEKWKFYSYLWIKILSHSFLICLKYKNKT